MNNTMRAISQDELGGPEVLKSTTIEVPEPGIGEVLVRVHAASGESAWPDCSSKQTARA
ncbi:hypothetical protein [Arthrobacter castelli]|uniref:hypothetical protein n=1 Tax=Arthrobacter castelli TaxID=271431 RepID=UPI0004131ECE|nr:hypothetical protein [Arthrobacter castelli]